MRLKMLLVILLIVCFGGNLPVFDPQPVTPPVIDYPPVCPPYMGEQPFNYYMPVIPWH